MNTRYALVAAFTVACGNVLAADEPTAPTNAKIEQADFVEINRNHLGSGQPGLNGHEQAERVDGNVFHVPQYMPGSPTSMSIWPRVLDVRCRILGEARLRCEGYNWSPAMGRAEYLYFRPVIVLGEE